MRLFDRSNFNDSFASRGDLIPKAVDQVGPRRLSFLVMYYFYEDLEGFDPPPVTILIFQFEIISMFGDDRILELM